MSQEIIDIIPEDAEVIESNEKFEIPDDLKSTIEDLKNKYGLNDQPNDIGNTTQNEEKPIIEKILSGNVKTLSRSLNNNGVVTLPNGEISYRKWKVKDKKTLETAKTLTDIKYALVLNCINYPDGDYSKYALDNEEISFLLYNIRNDSMYKPLKQMFICPDCGHAHTKEIDLTDIVKTEGGDYDINGNITVRDNNIVFGNPLNQALYDEFMSVDNLSDYHLFMTDMVLHIRKFNDFEINTRDDVLNVLVMVDDLDSDVADELVSKWNEIRYKTIIDNKVECPECGTYSKFVFEDLPGFYPSSWNDWNL